MIRLRQIKKSFRDKSGINEVLRGIDLEVSEGEFVSIMGPSGAGKSLLLSILGMYDSAWQGEYYFLDHAIHQLNPKQRAELNKRYIGFVFQQFHLLDDLTVAENLDVPLSYRNIRKSERQALWRTCWIASAWLPARMFIPAGSPAGSSNWSRWLARLLLAHACCWPTSP